MAINMERLISDEERIRRAEDVLERRKNTDLRISSESFVKEKSSSKLRRMLWQILICLTIYCGVFYIKNSKNQQLNFIIGNINNILNYDINFSEIYGSIAEKFKAINVNLNDSDSTESTQNNTETEQDELNKNSEKNESNNEDSNQAEQQVSELISLEDDLGIGGSMDETRNDEVPDNNLESQMITDANYIKTNYILTKPINNYRVTSEFGARESSEIVSANHKGIDLGALTGTNIFSALDGVVVEASDIGDYGIHLKIQTDNIIVTYAHCSKLVVKQGDKVTKGQKIAEVGSTGKATGPHLHFEVRVDSRAVNPRMIMEF